MAEMVCSALVQDAVSRGVSSVLSRREEKASQGHLMQRLKMAVSELEFALERAQELPIRHLSLPDRRKQLKLAYVEAMELIDRHNNQQVLPEQVAQGAKRRRWVLYAKNMSTSSFAILSTDDVLRFEWYADHAGRFVRDVESGCSLHHNTFCNPIVRHLLQGKTLQYSHWEQGNLLRGFFIWPTYYDERGVEAAVLYIYKDRTMTEKNFNLLLFLRLSESTDIVGVAVKGLQLLTSEFKLAAEFAIGEVSMLSNSQDIAHSYGPHLWAFKTRIWNTHNFFAQTQHVAKEVSTDFVLTATSHQCFQIYSQMPEQVIYWGFSCYYVPPLGPSISSHSSFDVVGRSKSRGGGMPPLVLTVAFAPHEAIGMKENYALEIIRDVKEYRDASIQQVVETLKSNAINCFFGLPKLTKYQISWSSKHDVARFRVKKASIERTGGPKTRRRYNTRGSTRRSRRR